jgi:hypothetical protein
VVVGELEKKTLKKMAKMADARKPKVIKVPIPKLV